MREGGCHQPLSCHQIWWGHGRSWASCFSSRTLCPCLNGCRDDIHQWLYEAGNINNEFQMNNLLISIWGPKKYVLCNPLIQMSRDICLSQQFRVYHFVHQGTRNQCLAEKSTMLTGIAPDGVQVFWIYFTQTGWIIIGFPNECLFGRGRSEFAGRCLRDPPSQKLTGSFSLCILHLRHPNDKAQHKNRNWLHRKRTFVQQIRRSLWASFFWPSP